MGDQPAATPHPTQENPLKAQTYIDEFDVLMTVYLDKFLIIKPTRCTNFSDLFLK
jgi:hypothetical protein